MAVSQSRRPPWRGRLQGSDTTWAIAFVVPYVAVFAAFVIYPVIYGLWMGSNPALYGLLFTDPLYLTTAVNTLLFVAIGVNVQMFLAFLLSGYFMNRSWWVRSLLAIYLLPWALPGLVVFTSIHFMLVTQWGLLDSLWRAVTGNDGPLFLVSPIAMGANIVSYIWKWMPFWTLIFLAARMAIPQDIYEAADDRRSHRIQAPDPRHVPLAGECLSHLHTALHHLDTRRFPHRVFRLQRRTGES